MITFLALSPAVDVTYLVDEFHEGGTFRPSAVVRAAGGKSLNAARAASAVGASVRAVAILGGASGEFVRDDLERAGIALDAVTAEAETRTCVSIASARSGSLTELYERPSAVSAEELELVRDVLRGRRARRAGGTDLPGWLAISGGTPASLPATVLADLIELGHFLGYRVAIDSHGAALAAALRARPDLVKVNRAEAAEALGCVETTDAFSMAEKLRSETGGRVLITDGVAGSFAVDEFARYRVAWAGEHGRYSVGSGDSYLGGLLAVLDGGGDFEEGLRLAVGCATANALVPGAGQFAAVEAEEIAAQVVVTRFGP